MGNISTIPRLAANVKTSSSTPQCGVVKQGFAGLLVMLMVQGAAFAESKFLSHMVYKSHMTYQ